MTTTTLTTFFGLGAAITAAVQAVPGIDSIPYARVVVGILSAVFIGGLGFYAKGRKDTGVQ